MALGASDITSTAIRNILGAASNTWSVLCTHANINKWSRNKPSNGVNMGLNVPTNWNLNTPASDYKEGDFRQYEHDKSLTPPPIRSVSVSPIAVNGGNFYPTTGAALANFPKEGAWYLAINTSADTVKILPVDLSVSGTTLDNYYFGVKITKDGTSYYKTKQTKLANNQSVSFDLTLTDMTPTYASFPSTGTEVGQWDWQLFMSFSKTATEAWTTSAPSGMINLPTDPDISSLYSNGHIHINHYLVCSSNSVSLAAPQSTKTSGYVGVVVTTSSGNSFMITKDDADPFVVGTAVYDPSNIEHTSSSEWITGYTIRIFAPANTGDARAATLVISSSGAGSFLINISQAGADPNISTSPISPVTFTLQSWTAINGGSSITIGGVIGGLTGTQRVYCTAYYEGVVKGTNNKLASNGTFTITINTGTLHAGTYVVELTNSGA